MRKICVPHPHIVVLTEMVQNVSHAVMAQRHEKLDSLDDFPTPPWATRALIEFVISPDNLDALSCYEPACGVGHMAKVLTEYFGEVHATDIFPYGFGGELDFLSSDTEDKFDWIITNPPFRLAEEFVLKSIGECRKGVAILARTVFLESIGRYNRLFDKHPPALVAQYSERVPMVKGRLDPKATTATGYAWIIWKKRFKGNTRLVWIPPCRRTLERPRDYEAPKAKTRKNRSNVIEPIGQLSFL